MEGRGEPGAEGREGPGAGLTALADSAGELSTLRCAPGPGVQGLDMSEAQQMGAGSEASHSRVESRQTLAGVTVLRA